MNKYDINQLVNQMYKKLQPFDNQIQKIVNDPATNKLKEFNTQVQKIVEVPAIKKLSQFGNQLQKILKDPATQRAMQNLQVWVENQEKIAPHMTKILDDMKNNANYSEALETIPYRQLLRLIVDSEKVEDINLLNLINQNVFQKPILNYFDKINLGPHFMKRKPLIEEAFQLYKLGLYAGCLTLLHSQFEGIITDYLIHKKVIEKKIVNSKTKFKMIPSGTVISGLSQKIELAKNINDSFMRLESFRFDNNTDVKFHNERNDILHGSNIANFNAERCFVVFIWIDSILGSIYTEEVTLKKLVNLN
ncbi:hypothetical protein [Acinetobacter pittii]|uniref:hypothetical protein n=1 Tax=Acinetobacter pittii TaxID=48296 RepID=UPI001CD2B8A7|nr:hypothetical protein [Acinetobacter pittii]